MLAGTNAAAGRRVIVCSGVLRNGDNFPGLWVSLQAQVAVIVGIPQCTVPASHAHTVTTAADFCSRSVVATDNAMQTRQAGLLIFHQRAARQIAHQAVDHKHSSERVNMPNKLLCEEDCRRQEALDTAAWEAAAHLRRALSASSSGNVFAFSSACRAARIA